MMNRNAKGDRRYVVTLVAASLVGSLGVAGCENLPGNEKSQGTVIGGLAGAGAGALIGGEDNRLIGALIGGAVGAGGGYLVGANWDKITGQERDDAEEAVRRAQENPATAEQARRAETADVNADGFVTMDEIVAMEKAGFSNREIIRRLEATDQYFELTTAQERDLRQQGIDQDVIVAMREMAPEEATPESRQEVLSRRTRETRDRESAGAND
jgi:hypothetical protein